MMHAREWFGLWSCMLLCTNNMLHGYQDLEGLPGLSVTCSWMQACEHADVQALGLGASQVLEHTKSNHAPHAAMQVKVCEHEALNLSIILPIIHSSHYLDPLTMCTYHTFMAPS